MKRIFKTAAIAALSVLAAVSCSQDRNTLLKVYNWSDYIDEDLISEFEQWYKEQTGEDVTVVYQLFDINETMLSKIEKGHEDYDVVCPSDYIIERMLQQDLLLPIGNLDDVLGDTPNYMKDCLSPYVKDQFSKMIGHGKNANDYSVGYMWGTTGILYNPKYVPDEEAASWSILQNPKYKGKILMKDSARDVYSQVLIYLKRDELAAGKVTLDELMYDSSPESMKAVEDFLAVTKEYVAGWEADFGKEQMTQERAWLGLNWSGDAVWAIVEAEELKEAGKDIELRFVVPDEGAAVWFDGWVIPKYAKNIKAAKYWINFMCRPESAIRNMDVTGYVSCNGAPEVLESQVDERFEPVDLTYFFGPGYDSVRVRDVLYPDAEVIARCNIEHDWGDKTPQLTEFWARVKGDNASSSTYIIIAAVVVALGAAIVYGRMGKRNRHRRRTSRR